MYTIFMFKTYKLFYYFMKYSLNYNFACGSVWVWNLASNIKGGT
jgi:hypothetical protein